MKKTVLVLLAFIMLVMCGCTETKPASRFTYRNEPVEKVTVYCMFASPGKPPHELDDEEIQQYLNLLETLPDRTEWSYGALIGGQFPVTVSIKTDNKTYSTGYIPSLGSIYDSDYYSLDVLPDSPLMTFVRKLTYDSLNASDSQYVSMVMEGLTIEPMADKEGKLRYLIDGKAQAKEIMRKLNLDLAGEESFSQYASNLAGKDWKPGSEVSFDEGKARLIYLGNEPDYYMIVYPDVKAAGYPVYLDGISCEETEKGIRKTFRVSRIQSESDDLKMVISSRNSYDPEEFVTVTKEINGLEEGVTYSADLDSDQYTEEQKQELLMEESVSCEIYQDDRLVFSGTIFNKTYDIINDYKLFSDSMRADHDMKYNCVDAERFYGTGRNIFDKGRDNDFTFETLSEISFGNNVYEYAVGIKPFFLKEYDVDSIGIYDEDGELYKDEVAGETYYWDTDYHWKNYQDYQALVMVFSLHDPQQEKLYIRVNYNDGTVSQVSFDPKAARIQWKNYAGRWDVLQIRDGIPYKHLFTADRYLEDYYNNYPVARVVISPAAVRRLGNERSLGLLSEKTREQIEEAWGQPIREEKGTVYYHGSASWDEIAVTYDKENKVSGIDYENIYNARITSVNGHEINVTCELGPVRVSVYKKVSEKQLAEFVQGADVIIRFRGLLYENRPEDIEIQLRKN